MSLGARIREIRRSKGLTQKTLAGTELSVSFISMLEHDRVRPSLASLGLLAERLDTTVAELLKTETPRGEAEALLRHGDVLLKQHQFTPAVEQYQAAVDLAEQAGDAPRRVRAHLGVGQALLGLRQFDLAQSHLTQAQELAGQLGERRLHALVAQALGLLELRRRHFSAARGHLNTALTLVRQAAPPDPRLEATILTNLGRVYLSLTLPLQALGCFEEARPLLETAADPSALVMLQINSALAYAQQHAYEEAAHQFQQAADVLEAQENLQLLGGVKRNLGMLLLERGDAETAEPLLRQSLAIARQLADDPGAAHTLTELARAALAQGRVREAESQATEAARLAERVEDPAEKALATMVLGDVARRDGEVETATTRYREAATVFTRLEMLKEAGDALRELGFVYLDTGREGEAARAFAQAFTAHKATAAAKR